METANKKIRYWIEDFDGVRRLTYACLYPDDVGNEDMLLIKDKLVEYFANNLNTSNYKKVYVIDRMIYKSENKEFENIQDVWKITDVQIPPKAKELRSGYYENDKGKVYLSIFEIQSNAPSDIGIEYGFLLFVPIDTDLKRLANDIFDKCRKANFIGDNDDKLQAFFESLIKEIPHSSIVTDFGQICDGRIYSKTPEGTGIIFTQNVYGELRNKEIPQKYSKP